MHVILIVLAASVGLVERVPQREQVHIAAAVWRISSQVRVTGDFRTADESTVASVVTQDNGHGSGFMVSADGYMLTADHVVSPSDAVRDTCTGLRETYARVVARSMSIEYAMEDIVQNQVAGRIVVLPKVAGGDICADATAIAWKHDDALPFRIVRSEPAADLALVKVTVADAAFIGTAPATLQAGTALYALGFPEPQRLVRATGPFVRSCEEVTGLEQADGSIDPTKYRFMTVATHIHQGMSGGPLMAGTGLAGVSTAGAELTLNVQKADGTIMELTAHVSHAVPAAYVHAWYLWATGSSGAKPEPCADPYRELEEKEAVNTPRR